MPAFGQIETAREAMIAESGKAGELNIAERAAAIACSDKRMGHGRTKHFRCDRLMQ